MWYKENDTFLLPQKEGWSGEYVIPLWHSPLYQESIIELVLWAFLVSCHKINSHIPVAWWEETWSRSSRQTVKSCKLKQQDLLNLNWALTFPRFSPQAFDYVGICFSVVKLDESISWGNEYWGAGIYIYFPVMQVRCTHIYTSDTKLSLLDVLESSLIGASLSEPHLSNLNGGFFIYTCIHVYYLSCVFCMFV